jgi:hypothetical protein
MAVIAILVVGLAHSVAALAGRLADEQAAYQGQWPGNPYSRDDYERVTSTSTEELVNAPHAVAERLVAPLLRGLGIAPRYLPYQP